MRCQRTQRCKDRQGIGKEAQMPPTACPQPLDDDAIPHEKEGRCHHGQCPIIDLTQRCGGIHRTEIVFMHPEQEGRSDFQREQPQMGQPEILALNGAPAVKQQLIKGHHVIRSVVPS